MQRMHSAISQGPPNSEVRSYTSSTITLTLHLIQIKSGTFKLSRSLIINSYFVSWKIFSRRVFVSASSSTFPVYRSTIERSKYGATFDKARSSIKYKKYRFFSLLGPSPLVSTGSKRRLNSLILGPHLGLPQVSKKKCIF